MQNKSDTSNNSSEQQQLAACAPPSDILICELVTPMRILRDIPLHSVLHDYLRLNGITQLSAFDWYTWPAMLRGR